MVKPLTYESERHLSAVSFNAYCPSCLRMPDPEKETCGNCGGSKPWLYKDELEVDDEN